MNFSGAVFTVLQAGRNQLTEAAFADIDSFVVLPAAPETPVKDKLRLEGIYRLFSRTLRGEFAATGDDYFFLLAKDGRYIGHAAYSVGHRNPAIGILNFVLTAPEWRGRGLATDLSRALMQHFRERGGQAMYLGHSGPVARGVYERCGFRDYHGRAMRWLAEGSFAGDFDRTYFAPTADLTLRPVEWGDGAMATCLFTIPDPWVVRDFTDGTFCRPNVEWVRSTSIFYALYGRSEQPGNPMHVIQAGPNRVVGCVSLLAGPDPSESLLEFMLHPNIAPSAPDLFRGHLSGRKNLICYAAPDDATRRSVLESLGFGRQAALAVGGLQTWKA